MICALDETSSTVHLREQLCGFGRSEIQAGEDCCHHCCIDRSLDSSMAWMNRSDTALSVDVSIQLALGAGNLSMSAILDLDPSGESVSWYGGNMIPTGSDQLMSSRPS